MTAQLLSAAHLDEDDQPNGDDCNRKYGNHDATPP